MNKHNRVMKHPLTPERVARDDSAMKQKVLLFARARDLAGGDMVEIELAEGARIGDVRRELLASIPGLQPLAGSLLIAMNNSYAADETMVEAGAEIACFPPVSGG